MNKHPKIEQANRYLQSGEYFDALVLFVGANFNDSAVPEIMKILSETGNDSAREAIESGTASQSSLEKRREIFSSNVAAVKATHPYLGPLGIFELLEAADLESISAKYLPV